MPGSDKPVEEDWGPPPTPERGDPPKTVPIHECDDVTAAPPPPPDADRVGPPIPGYVARGELGRGGSGVVYRAEQVSLARPVALKVVYVGEESARYARLKREAQAAASLSHPNIVRVYEVGRHGEFAFLSMELVDGGTLDARIRRKLFSPDEAAGVMIELADAVAYAHSQNSLHLDLKPANVLLDASGRAILADFGLVRRLNDKGRAAEPAGTPGYMAPEQLKEDYGEVGPASDTYALGATLYEMLTGRVPVPAATPEEAVMRLELAEPLPPRRLRPDVPGDLEMVCLKCLRKDPAGRYTSPAALAADLRRFATGRAVAAAPASALGRLRRWAGRAPREAVWAGLFAVSTLILLCLLLFRPINP